jgi:hypothetical protein
MRGEDTCSALTFCHRLLFEMCCGWSPFYAEDTQQMYRNICFGKIKFPRGAIGDDGKQFVKGVSMRCCGRPAAGLSMQS